MLIDCTLEDIRDYLNKEMVSCTIEKKKGDKPTDFLLIDMGEDEKGRPQMIEIFAAKKEIPETEIYSKKKFKKEEPSRKHNEDKPNYLHIQYLLPFEFRSESVNDIARFLLLINKTLVFTGFGMSEVDRLVYFRHDFFADRSKVNTEVLKGVLGYLLLIVDSFSPTIEKLAMQKTTFQKVIEQVQANK